MMSTSRKVIQMANKHTMKRHTQIKTKCNTVIHTHQNTKTAKTDKIKYEQECRAMWISQTAGGSINWHKHSGKLLGASQ